MGFLEDARKLANLGQGAARNVESAAGEAWKHGSAFGQEVAKRAGPAVADARERLEKLSEEAGKHAAPIANSASRHAVTFAQYAYNNANQGLHALLQVPNEDSHKGFDWKFIDEFGEDMAKRLGSTAEDFWQKLSSNDILNGIGEATLPKFEFEEEDFSGFSERLKAWILANPKQFATLLACIASGPVVFVVTPAMLGLAGFTPIGIAAGSMASAFQASVGPIAAGSAFAILTSAAMGGYELVIVQAIAISSTVTGTCGIAAMAFLEAVKEDAQCKKEKTE